MAKINYGSTYSVIEELLRSSFATIGMDNIESSSQISIINKQVLGLTNGEILLHSNETPPDYIIDRLNYIIRMRTQHKPLQYIIGNTDFAFLNIKCDPRALIPRNDTERLVECILAHTNTLTYTPHVLDLCTGSGCIALALSKVSQVTGSDISISALSLAEENSKALGLNVNWIKSDMFHSVEGRFDIICSNPPYIPSADIAGLSEEVYRYEPLNALDGGTDGLDFYRIIAEKSPAYLNEDGLIALEIGYNQADAVKEIFDKYSVEIVSDYSGNDRVILAKSGGKNA